MTDLVLRKAAPSDSLEEIAKLIYDTDPFIYPVLYSGFTEDFCKLIKTCLNDRENFYYLDNLYVAEANGKIISLIAAVKNQKTYRFLPEKSEKAPDQRAVEGYYAPLITECAELSGHTVVNVCTDSDYRGKGIAKALLSYYLDRVTGETVYLDVLADNTAAISLYQALGFSILNAYDGFGIEKTVKCYHMRRN